MGWSKLGEKGDGLTFFSFSFYHIVPPSKMSLYGTLPLRRPGIVDLWSFRMTDARMDVVCTRQCKVNGLLLILQQRLMHITPV